MRELKLIGGICLFLFLMVLAIPLWILSANHANKIEQIKVAKQIVNDEGAVTNYDHFLNKETETITLSSLEKIHLIDFIILNCEIISGKTSPEDLDITNKHIEVSWNVPKLSTAPVTDAMLHYTFISKAATKIEKGISSYYLSAIKRKDDQSAWLYSDLVLRNYDHKPIFSNFNENDLSRLGLTLVKVTFAKNYTTEAGNLKPLEKLDPVAFKQAKDNYAFYEFQSNTQPHPLTVTFVVQQKQYNENASLPRNWHYIHIQRTASQS